jgi:hypothetical protein
MTLTKLLFEPTLVRSPLSVIRWWESRRPLYNLAVGVTGLGVLGYSVGLELLLGNGLLEFPLIGVVAYGIAANVCYTLGPAAEMTIERFLRRPVYGLGPALFRYGLVFSLGLTLLPAAMITVVNIAGAIFR